MARCGAVVLTIFGVVPILTLDYTLYTPIHICDALSKQEQTQPLVHTIENGAVNENLYQVDKLYFLVSKLFVKQSIRVGKCQIKRRSGIHQIVGDASHCSVDRIRNPMESVGMDMNFYYLSYYCCMFHNNLKNNGLHFLLKISLREKI